VAPSNVRRATRAQNKGVRTDPVTVSRSSAASNFAICFPDPFSNVASPYQLRLSTTRDAISDNLPRATSSYNREPSDQYADASERIVVYQLSSTRAPGIFRVVQCIQSTVAFNYDVIVGARGRHGVRESHIPGVSRAHKQADDVYRRGCSLLGSGLADRRCACRRRDRGDPPESLPVALARTAGAISP
jgi:hypothetical protein